MSLQINRASVFDEKPKAVIFDTDNTLYYYEKPHAIAMQAVESKACKTLGVSKEKFNQAFSEARKLVKGRLKTFASSHSRLLYFQRTIELLGMRTQLLLTLDLEQTYWRTFLSQCELFAEVKDFIQDLRREGIHTAIITDLTSQIQFRKIIYFGLDEYFDYVVTSEEAGVDKPNAEPFHLALEKLALEPKDIWMIGDSAENDIEGASAIGMITLQKRHKNVVVSVDPKKVANIVFEEFSELRRFFKQKYGID